MQQCLSSKRIPRSHLRVPHRVLVCRSPEVGDLINFHNALRGQLRAATRIAYFLAGPCLSRRSVEALAFSEGGVGAR